MSQRGKISTFEGAICFYVLICLLKSNQELCYPVQQFSSAMLKHGKKGNAKEKGKKTYYIFLTILGEKYRHYKLNILTFTIVTFVYHESAFIICSSPPVTLKVFFCCPQSKGLSFLL